MNENVKERIRNIQDANNSYLNFLEELQKEKNKYKLPVLMEVCSFKEIKLMDNEELKEVHEIANLKLQKQILEISVILSGILNGG